MSEDEQTPNVIIDNGTGHTKAGFSGEEGPRATFPTVVGYPKSKSAVLGAEQKEFYVGTSAVEKMGVLNLQRPMENGIIENWEDIQKVWDHIYSNELRCQPTEHKVLLAETILSPREDREKIAEILFETFSVPGLYLAPNVVLSLYSTGNFHGLVCDSGEIGTRIASVFDGYALPFSEKKMNIGGHETTKYLVKLLTELGVQCQTYAEYEIAKDIKEKLCYVALDIEEEKKTYHPDEYEFPDGKVIGVNDQMFRAPEIMFKPDLIGWDEDGLDKKCYETIWDCDIDIRKDLFQNIILSGGNTLFRGFKERLEKGIKERSPEAFKGIVNVIAVPERKYSVWIGGSILSSLSTFGPNWITKEEYDEAGANVVHRKCF